MTTKELTRLRLYYLRDLNQLTLEQLRDYSDLLHKSRAEANLALEGVAK